MPEIFGMPPLFCSKTSGLPRLTDWLTPSFRSIFRFVFFGYQNATAAALPAFSPLAEEEKHFGDNWELRQVSEWVSERDWLGERRKERAFPQTEKETVDLPFSPACFTLHSVYILSAAEVRSRVVYFLLFFSLIFWYPRCVCVYLLCAFVLPLVP